MRIAGGIIGIFLAIIILVQSLAAGTANALAEKGQGDSAGSIGFLVAILFVTASALMIGKVRRGAAWVWAGAAVIAFTGSGTIFKDLIVWGVVAVVYAAMCFIAHRRAKASTKITTEVAASG